MNATAIYLEELRQRAGSLTPETFDRKELLANAAHDAYEAASNRLTGQYGWDGERALVVLRGLNGAVQRWIELGDGDWDRLRVEMQRVEEVAQGAGPAGAGGSGNPRS